MREMYFVHYYNTIPRLFRGYSKVIPMLFGHDYDVIFDARVRIQCESAGEEKNAGIPAPHYTIKKKKGESTKSVCFGTSRKFSGL